MSTQPQPRLVFSTEGPVATVRLNRPEVRNAIDDALQAELIALLERIAADAGLRAVIVTGEGTAFCAGGDVGGMRQRLDADAGELAMNGLRRLRHTQRMVSLLHDLDKITIAAVNGPAVGVGMDLALCCDFLVAADSAFLSMGYLQRGLVPDGGGLYHLPRRVGLARAKEIVFSGRRVPAEEALRLGMVDRVVPADQLADGASRWARELSTGSGPAIALSKSILNRTFELAPEDVLTRTAEAQAICYTTREHRDSVAAFLERRERRDRSQNADDTN